MMNHLAIGLATPLHPLREQGASENNTVGIVNDIHQRINISTADYNRNMQLFSILARLAFYPNLFLVALGGIVQVG
jgi:hypothetical protein